MKYSSYNDLINAMRRHVNVHVKHFKADAGYDYETIRRDMNAKKNVTYIWVLRDCGTFLLPVKDDKDAARSEAAVEYYDTVKDCFPANKRREYTIQLDSNSPERFTFKACKVTA